MKNKIILFAAVFGIILGTTALAADITFTPEGGGKWIFCNNPENIYNENLMNHPDYEPAYLMNNEHLTPDKYDFLICHLNCTETNNGYGAGFPVEVDAEITASEDSVITINKSFFEVPQDVAYIYGDGRWAKDMHKVSCLNALTSYLGVNFAEANGSWLYEAEPYEPVTIEIKKGETIWLSTYTADYDVVPYFKPVEILGEFELTKGEVCFNVCAFKSGEALGDRTGFTKKAAFGKYDRDRKQKGIAQSLPKVNAYLEYTLDNTLKDGDFIKNKIYNQYEKKGNVTDVWCTHLNPQDDLWSQSITAQSDLLTITYKDDSKLDYYGDKIKKNDRNNIWLWDPFHSDTSEYEGGSTWYLNRDEYLPNYDLSVNRSNYGYACSMGNYCVEECYNLKVKNTMPYDRYFEYVAETESNIGVYVEDEDGKHSGLYKGEWGDRKDVLASVKIPAKGEKEFKINVILPINCVGGIKNRFMVSDKCSITKTYEDFVKEKNDIEKGVLSYGTSASEVYDKLSDEAKKIVGDNGDYYELIETAWGYMLRYRDWDGLPYYYAANWKKLKTIYTLDKKYNVVTHYNPEAMIRAALYYDDGYYIEDADGNRFVTTDGRNWEEFSHRLPLVDVEFNNDEPSGWAADELTRAYEINAAPYDLKDKIDYDAPMTRTMFCYVLSTMLRRADMMPEDIDEDIEFTDTESNTIRKLATAGIISGYDDGSFRPEGEITRQEAAVLLYRAALSAYGNNVLEEYDKEMAEYFEEKGESTERALFATYDTYSDDKDINEWAYLPVYFLRDWNIMQGMTDGSFSPEMTYTNEQSIATILRLYDFINEYAKEKDR